MEWFTAIAAGAVTGTVSVLIGVSLGRRVGALDKALSHLAGRVHALEGVLSGLMTALAQRKP